MNLDRLRALAEDMARQHGDSITRAKGVRGEEVLFYAAPSDFSPDDSDDYPVIGPPYGYWVNMQTGTVRETTLQECEALTERDYLNGFQPIPE